MIKISDIEYFSDDRTIRFLQMDCNEFMKGCKENEFDLNLSDPPYGLKQSSTNGSGKLKNRVLNKQSTKWDVAPSVECFDNIFKTSINQIIWGGNYFDLPPTRCFLVWDKKQYMPTFSRCEFAWTSFYKPAKIFEYDNAGNDKIHATQKPIALYSWILDNYTKPTDTILDCFGGSMSNAIACHMKRRKLTIIELDVDYFQAAIKRFEAYETQAFEVAKYGYAKTKLSEKNPLLF